MGGGSIASRKVDLLRKAGADVTVVSPQLCDELEKLASSGTIRYLKRRYQKQDLVDCALVIAATDQADVNQRISADAMSRNIPVNVVDNPHLCSFIMPSIIDRSPVQIAVSTGGSSPVLARLVRTRLEGFDSCSLRQTGCTG